MTNELINLLWARAFASGHRHTTYRDGIESEYRCISKLQLAGLIHEATEQASQRIAQLETYISDNLHKKAICDCGDSIEPDTGAVCGTCASIEQASQPQTVSNARESYQYVVRRLSESGESFSRKQVGLIESIAVAAEEMGYQRGMKQASQPQWIPVSERMPQEGEPVLIWMRPETVHDSIHNVIVSNPVFARKQAELGFVTHWMPLPAVPKAIP